MAEKGVMRTKDGLREREWQDYWENYNC